MILFGRSRLLVLNIAQATFLTGIKNLFSDCCKEVSLIAINTSPPMITLMAKFFGVWRQVLEQNHTADIYIYIYKFVVSVCLSVCLFWLGAKTIGARPQTYSILYILDQGIIAGDRLYCFQVSIFLGRVMNGMTPYIAPNIREIISFLKIIK